MTFRNSNNNDFYHLSLIKEEKAEALSSDYYFKSDRY